MVLYSLHSVLIMEKHHSLLRVASINAYQGLTSTTRHIVLPERDDNFSALHMPSDVHIGIMRCVVLLVDNLIPI